MDRHVPVIVLCVLLLASCTGGPATSTPTPAGSAPGSPAQPTEIASPGTPVVSPSVTGSNTATPTDRGTATSSGRSTERATAERPGHAVTVVEVVDGDTMDVRYPNGSTDRIRLLGVDTPEPTGGTSPDEFAGIPDTPDGRAWLSDWADRASQHASERLAGESVRIATDPRADRRGSYDRLLVYVHVNGSTFNEALLENGYARLYDTAFSKRDGFAEAERRAQATDTGVWNYSAPDEGDDGTDVADSGLVVATIHADAAGNDHENLNDEYVVFENAGDGPIDVGGWTVSDAGGHRYVVPPGTTVAEGARITLYSGSGETSDTELYWESDAAIWNNDGDTITVRDESGTVVLERRYR